jgi:hypothetical protein
MSQVRTGQNRSGFEFASESLLLTSAATKILVCLALIAVLCLTANAQSQTASEFWPEVNFHYEFPENWRALGFVGLKKGEDFPYQQLNTGLGLGYQWKRISKPHPENIDPDKEFTLVFGGGYEYLQTFQSKGSQNENRLVLEAIPGFRPASPVLLRDRNRVEFRWVNGNYSTRYRNDVSFEYDIVMGSFQLSPYASAEFFYDGAKGSWNEEQYTGGLQWPYRRILMIQTYYLRQNCTTCTPPHLNVGGLTLNLFFGR